MLELDLGKFDHVTNHELTQNAVLSREKNNEKINAYIGGGVTIPEPSDAGKHAVGISMSRDTMKDITGQLSGQFVDGHKPPIMASIKHNGGRKTKRTKRKTKRKTKKAKRKTKRKTKKAKRKTKRKTKRKNKRKTKRTKRKTKGCNCRNCKCACCLKKRKRKRR